MEMHSFTYVKRLLLKNAKFEEFSDFPVLVIIDDSAGYYPALEAYNQIAFYASDNTTELKWGCKEFNDGGKSYYIVKVPTVLATDTDYIYMYWGGNTSLESKSGVCDANTVLMTPCVDYGDTSHIEDWTGVNTLTKKGAGEPASASGDMGLCQDFDGSDDYIGLSSTIAAVTKTGTYTIEIYLKNTIDTNSRLIFKNTLSVSNRNAMSIYNGNVRGGYYDGSIVVSRSGNLVTNTDAYIAFTFNAGTPVLLINSINQSGTSSPYTDSNVGATIGGSAGYTPYKDLIYMVRVSDIVRSANWLKAQDKILRTQDYVTYRGIICTFTLANNQLTTVTGADAGTYPIKDNKTDIVIGGVTHSIYPFSSDHFVSSKDNLLTIEV